MSDYTQIVNYGPKDGLTSGDPNKLIRGTEIDAELAAIAVAVASKFDDSSVNALAGPGLSEAGLVLTVGAVAAGGILVNADDLELDIAGLTTQGSAAAPGDFVAIELAGGGKRKLTVTNLVSGTGFTPTSRTLTAGNGLTGGGDLTADRTFDIGILGDGLSVAADSISLVQATESAIGGLEIATQAETDAGSDDTRVVTPAKLAAFTGLGSVIEYDEQGFDQTVNNSTTLVNSAIAFTNIATGRYKITALLYPRDVAVSNCGIRFAFATTGVSTNNMMRSSYEFGVASSGTPTTDIQGRITTVHNFPSLDAGATRSFIMVEGTLDVTSGTNTITLQFAQNTAQVGDLDLETGSFVALQKLD